MAGELADSSSRKKEALFANREEFARIVPLLRERGYAVIGPTIEQGAIVYAPIDSVEQLPIGWTDRQEAGMYRLERRADDAWFGYVVGPFSWKQYLFPPHTKMSESLLTAEGWEFRAVEDDAPMYAFLGVRACDLAALAIQDRVFMNGPYVDPVYEKRRRRALTIAVNCTQAAPTCFCASMGTGPHCRYGFDIAVTELSDGFLLEVGSERGEEIVSGLATSAATELQMAEAHQRRARAVAQITRKLDTHDIRNVLLSQLEHPRWQHVAERCLSCANCTMVCPTCFCCSVEEVADLAETRVERHRSWDSCFNWNFSYMNGGIVRQDIRARYRQWLTHKLASWIDQFGVSGCVGCGRCITWCPVGIDLTEEVAVIRGEAT
ncbi:MAG: cytochrome c [Pirellulaceae bacterium]|nr:MAG: cytochrome c [Pirellulaceae bacterium]